MRLAALILLAVLATPITFGQAVLSPIGDKFTMTDASGQTWEHSDRQYLYGWIAGRDAGLAYRKAPGCTDCGCAAKATKPPITPKPVTRKYSHAG